MHIVCNEEAAERARARVRELGYWIASHASRLTDEMDELTVAEDGIHINSTIDLDGITSVKVVKNYLIING